MYSSDFERLTPTFCKYILFAGKVSCCRARWVTLGPTHQEDGFYAFITGLEGHLCSLCPGWMWVHGENFQPFSLSLQLKATPTGQFKINTGKVGHEEMH